MFHFGLLSTILATALLSGVIKMKNLGECYTSDDIDEYFERIGEKDFNKRIKVLQDYMGVEEVLDSIPPSECFTPEENYEDEKEIFLATKELVF